jgi:ADP-heptose:LPS heptosyltransferase/GT2 family glycosyltransferase
MNKNIKGLTVKQINDAIFGNKNIKSSKNKKFIKLNKKNKPEHIFRNKQKHNLGLLLNNTYSTNQIVSECPTPTWFTSSGSADVSVVVPLYKNSIENIVETWDFFNDGIKVELIFVDDNCPENSGNKVLSCWEKRLDEIKKPIGKILRSCATQGWGACCNAGAAKASGNTLIFLNPEVKLFPGWISNLVKTLRKTNAGCVGGLFIDEENDCVIEAGREWDWQENKFLEIGAKIYKNKKISSSFKMDNVPAEIFQAGEKEFVSSNLMAVKREDFLSMGGFSPIIHNKEWSDADFCLNILEKNKKIIYQPLSRIYGKNTVVKANTRTKSDEAIFFNKWITSGRLNSLIKNNNIQNLPVLSILINRQAAHGDVLIAAAVAPALKKKYPEADIIFATDCPEVLHNNPWIDKVVTECSERQFHLFFNLDMVYEYRPKTNFLTSYAESVGVDPKDCELFLETEELDFELPENYVVIHAGNSIWAGRGWSTIKFDQISNRLQKEGVKIICVGTSEDHKPLCCDYDLRNKTSIGQLATIIKNSDCFIGVDSFPMHVAQVFEKRGVAFFGSILPETRLINKSIIPVYADGIKCLGCHHRKPVPCVATTMCEIGVQECIIGVSVDRMWKTIQQALQNKN